LALICELGADLSAHLLAGIEPNVQAERTVVGVEQRDVVEAGGIEVGVERAIDDT
jgi:hypothetical protein